MLTPIRLLNLGLMVVIVALGIGFSHFTQTENEPALNFKSVTASSATASESAPQTATFAKRIPMAGSYEIIDKKNVFSPDRRPIEATPAPTATEPEKPAVTEPPANLTLIGTIITKEAKVALISEPSIKGGQVQQYHENDKILEFAVKEIEPNRVKLGNAAGSEITIHLQQRNEKKGAKKNAAPERGKAKAAADNRERAARKTEEPTESNPARDRAARTTKNKLPFPLPGAK